MKIDPQLTTTNTSTSAGRVAQGQEIASARKAASQDRVSGRGSDEMILSQQAKDIMFAQKVLAQTPEVRQEKVAQLQQQIAEGSFRVDAQLIADKIIEGGV